MTAVWPWEEGSKNAAKLKPMVALTILPAISTAENVMLITVPIATPVIISWTTINRPGRDIGSSAGRAGTLGEISIARKIPRLHLTLIGTIALLKGGAIAMTPRIRVSGQIKAASQV